MTAPADRSISQHTALPGSALADNDVFECVDVSDTTDAVTGTNKRLTALEAAGGLYAKAGKAGAVLVVDAVNGNDATGTRGYLSRPFLTLTAAKAAASSGDCVRVYPGTYNEKNLAKTGVNWHFYPGAAVVYSGALRGAIFDDGPNGAAAACSYVVTGRGVFENRTAYTVTAGGINDTGVLNLVQPGSSVHFEARSLLAAPTLVTSPGCVTIQNGTLVVRCETITNAIYDALLGIPGGTHSLTVTARTITGHQCLESVRGGTYVVHADALVAADGSADFATTLDGGDVSIYAGTITGQVLVEGDGAGFPTTRLRVYGARITSSNADGAVGYTNVDPGVLELNNCRVENTGAGPAVGLLGIEHASSVPVLSRCVLVSAGTYAVTADAAANVRNYGSVANKTKDANVTFLVTTPLTVSTDVT